VAERLIATVLKTAKPLITELLLSLKTQFSTKRSNQTHLISKISFASHKLNRLS